MGDISIKGRSPLLKGGRVGFATGEKVLGTPTRKVGGISRLTGETGGVKEVFPGMGITGGASRGVKVKKPYVKEKRSIGEVTYTKPSFKKWKKSKTEQYKKKQAHIKKGKESLEAKYPGFKFTKKNKGGKV